MAHYVICDNKCLEEGLSKTAIENELTKKSDTGHTHTYNDVTGKPSTFPPASHTHDDRYYTESECNAKYKLKGDFAVITGTILGFGNTDIAYPYGYTKNNCVPVSIGTQRLDGGGQIAFENALRTSAYSAGGLSSTVSLKDSALTLYTNPMVIIPPDAITTLNSKDKTYNYKIVLMRV